MTAITMAGGLPFFGPNKQGAPRAGCDSKRANTPVARAELAPGPGLVEAIAQGLLDAASGRRARKSRDSQAASSGSKAGTIARCASECGAETDMPLADRSDEALMTAYLAGDRTAFVELVERYRTDLHTFLTRFLGSSSAADDVFQDTFLQVHLAAHTFDQERNFKPWLFTIAANKARDWHRRQKRRAAASLDAPLTRSPDSGRLIDLLEADSQSPGAPSEAQELRVLVKQSVDALPTHYREILLLNYFQRMSYNQIAEVLGIPLGTVKSRLHAAVAAFAEGWKAAQSKPGSGASPKASTRSKRDRRSNEESES